MDNMMLMLFFTVLPVILLLVFVYNKDRAKEPLVLLLQLFGLGMISCIPVLFASDFFRIIFPFMNKRLVDYNFFETILYAFVEVALLEEICKWIMLYAKGYNHQEFDEVYDIIVYAVFVSLGFALVENIAYVFLKGTLRTALFRAVSSVPGHACDAVFMGYFLSLAKQASYKDDKKLEKKYIVLSIIVPAILHGIYDFCLMSGYEVFVLIFIIFITCLYIISFRKIKELSNDNMIIKHRLKK
jgi:RsiW-degrading membrane proteinase PrsW (M82 family)